MLRCMSACSVWRRWALAPAIVCVGYGMAVAAGVPDDKQVIVIDCIPGKKGAVEFKHAEHVTKNKKPDGSAIVCKDCHHTLKGDEPTAGEAPPKPCTECHVALGKTPKKVGDKEAPPVAKEKTPGKVDKKSVLFHKNCLEGCHKPLKKTIENKKIAACKTCHKKGE